MEYKNKFWIRQNAMKLGIKVLVEDCVFGSRAILKKDIFSESKWTSTIVQEGEIVNITEIDFEKEALILKRHKDYKDECYILIYFPNNEYY